jgi:hypothetical protein
MIVFLFNQPRWFGTVVVFYFFFSSPACVPGLLLLYIIVIDTYTGKWWRAGTRHRKEPDALQWKLLFSFFSSWKWAVAAVLLHQFEGGSVYVYIYACPWISHREDCHKSHCQIFYFYIPSPIQTQRGEGFYFGCPQLDSVSACNNMETFSFFPMERTCHPLIVPLTG